MADVFVSYSRKDRDRVEPFVAMLEARGWSVWWDRDIRYGDRYRPTIERELAAAACVVVVWSAQSVGSDWVLDEAEKAGERDVLLPVRIDDVDIPAGFGGFQTADLIAWSAAAGATPLPGELTDAIAERIARSAEHPIAPPPIARPRRPIGRPVRRSRRRAVLSIAGGFAAMALVLVLAAPHGGGTPTDDVTFATDTAVAMTIDTLGRMPEDVRAATLGKVGRILGRYPGVDSLARARLAAFVREETRWTVDSLRCAAPIARRADVAAALRLLARPRAMPAQRATWIDRLRGRSATSAAATASAPSILDSTNLAGLALDSAADLRGVSLVGACLAGARLRGARLDSARLDDARIDSADFTGASLRHASLEFATGRGASFANARLEDASLNGATVPDADFSGARLACATFQYATLDGARLLGARLPWAFLDAASLRDVVDWSQLDTLAAAGAFVRTAKLDAPRLSWAYRRGADSTRATSVEWTARRTAQLAPDSACGRSLREPWPSAAR